MPTQDEEIARHLREALASGELAGTKGFGKPFAEDEGWQATPESLRMPSRFSRMPASYRLKSSSSTSERRFPPP